MKNHVVSDITLQTTIQPSDPHTACLVHPGTPGLRESAVAAVAILVLYHSLLGKFRPAGAFRPVATDTGT
jgi:hypothetical protein